MKDQTLLKNKKKTLPGSGITYHQFTEPVAEILNTFKSPFDIPSTVTFTTNEMTALCPLTGQPDQYKVKVTYIPTDKCIESKSAKFYFGAYRSYKGFIEQIAQKIYDDWSSCECEWIEVDIEMNPRGGVAIRTVISSDR